MEKEKIESAEVEPKPEKQKKQKKQRVPMSEQMKKRLSYGGYTAAVVVLFVAGVALLNIVVNLALARVPAADLTENRLYEIDGQTADFLKNVKADVSVIVCEDEDTFDKAGEYYKQANAIFRRFADTSPRIKLSYMSPLKNPSMAETYGTDVSTGGAVVVKNDATDVYRILKTTDYLKQKYYMSGGEISADEAQMYQMFGQGADISSSVDSAAERALLQAVAKVTDENPVKIAFSTGFGEVDNAPFKEILEKAGFETFSLNLMTDDLSDSDADLLVIDSPAADLTPDVTEHISAWLDGGGAYGKSLMYVAPVGGAPTPGADALIAEWGVEVEGGVIAQTDSRYVLQNNPMFQIFNTTSDVGSDLKFPVYGYYIRAVTPLFENEGGITVSELVSAYDGAVYVPFESLDNPDFSLESAQESGAGAIVKGQKTNLDTKSSSSVVVLGGGGFLEQTFLDLANAGNAEFFTELVSDVTGGQDMTNGLPKELIAKIIDKPFTQPAFMIDTKSAFGLGAVFAVFLPLCVIIFGVVVWTKRRRS